ncbi:MAG: DUF58 domain-containing protein [Acidiphilium sp.]
MAEASSSARRTARAQSLAARLPALVLAAQRLAASASPGRHGRRRPGAGEQFWQYRDARDGDSPRAVDWRRSARGERLYIREREWESVETLVLDVDDGAGMAFTSDARNVETKRERALLLGLALAALALDGGEQVAAYARTPAFSGPGALDRLAIGLLLPRQATPCAGRLALIGDFLEPPETIAAGLAARAASTRGGVLVQVLDPAECDFPWRGRVLFEGMAAEAPEDVARAEEIASLYRDRLGAQRLAVVAAAEAARFVPLFHRTDAPPATVLAAMRVALEPA